jgi:hypothetical protein
VLTPLMVSSNEVGSPSIWISSLIYNL